MIAYLDSSVILRVVLGQPEALGQWDAIERGVVSALVEVECLRTLDRMRFVGGASEEAIAIRRHVVTGLLKSVEVVSVTAPILRRASQPLPVTVGTLDAIHLATALLWCDAAGENLVMATHDFALGAATRAMGLTVIGC